MSSISDVLASVPTELSLLASFSVGKYIWQYEGYFDSHRLAFISIAGQHRFIYDSRFSVNRATTVSTCLKLSAH